MTVQANKALIRDWVSAWSANDCQALGRLYSDEEFSWRISGVSPVSGKFDKPTILRILKDTFELETQKKVQFRTLSMTAEDDRVSLEVAADGEFPGGERFENYYHFLFVIRNGMIVYGCSYFDTYSVLNSPLRKVPVRERKELSASRREPHP